MTHVLEYHGYDELQKAVQESPTTVLKIMMAGMRKISSLVVGIVKEYPPATAANRPGRVGIVRRGGVPREVPIGFYERGRGWWAPVKEASALGGKTLKSEGVMMARGGKQRARLSAIGVAGYKLRATSEQLGKSWTYQVNQVTGAIEAVIGNDTRYANKVQGSDRSHLFELRGWKTIDEAIDQAEPDIDAELDTVLEKFTQELAKNE